MSKRATPEPAMSKRPKTKPDLPDLDHSKAAVLDSLRSPRDYRHAIDEFISWYCSEPRLSFNNVVVTRFRIFLENRGRGVYDQWPTCGCSPVSVRSCGCWLAQPRVGRRHPASERPQEVRCEAWQLALTADEARRFWQSADPDTLKASETARFLPSVSNHRVYLLPKERVTVYMSK